jgi:GTP-binding protein
MVGRNGPPYELESKQTMALPLVAVVGRANVGKSTLFNRFVGEMKSVVQDFPGVTRDRVYARGEINIRPVMLVDTGGMVGGEGDSLNEQVNQQAVVALRQADVLVVLVDGREGVTSQDHQIADIVRRSGKPHVLAVNKMERPGDDSFEFYELSLGEPIPISAVQGFGIIELEDAILDLLPVSDDEDNDRVQGEVAIAVVGRPNAGKSALINAILGEQRLIVSEIAGTTRDAVDTWIDYEGRPIRFVDTAGLRRAGKRGQGTEYYSALRTMRALERADIAVVVVDSTEGMTSQDARVALEAHDMGRACIIVANKWDLVQETAFPPDDEDPIEEKHRLKAAKLIWKDFQTLVRHETPFAPYAPLVKTCALSGEGVEDLLPAAIEVFEQFDRRVETGPLNRCVRRAVQAHNPPSKRGRPLKVLYATQVRSRPPTFVFFVNDVSLMHFSYERYLINAIRKEFGFEGTPVRVLLRNRREEEDRK